MQAVTDKVIKIKELNNKDEIISENRKTADQFSTYFDCTVENL